MPTSAEATRLKAAYPLLAPQHLSDEDISYALDRSAKHGQAARKAQETRRQKRAVQGMKQEQGA